MADYFMLGLAVFAAIIVARLVPYLVVGLAGGVLYVYEVVRKKVYWRRAETFSPGGDE